MKSRRVYGKKRHNKTRRNLRTRKGGFFKTLRNFLNNPKHFNGPEESEYEKQLKAERESVAQLPLVAPPRGGRKTRYIHKKRSHRIR